MQCAYKLNKVHKVEMIYSYYLLPITYSSINAVNVMKQTLLLHHFVILAFCILSNLTGHLCGPLT